MFMKFPRLSSDGLHVVGEGPTREHHDYPVVVLNEESNVIGEGISPVWLTPRIVIYANGNRVWKYTLSTHETAILAELDRPIHKLEANQRGHWVAFHAPGATDWRRISYDTANWPGIDLDGNVLLCNDAIGEQYIRVTAAGRVSIRRPPNTYPRVAPTEDWGDYEAHWAVAILTSAGKCVLRLENERLVMSYGRSNLGWPISTGRTFHPDVAPYSATVVRIVATGDNNQFVQFYIDTAREPMVELGPATPQPEPEPPLVKPGVTVDQWSGVLDTKSTASIEFHDRNNAGFGAKVELVPQSGGGWSWHATLVNPAGKNRSGTKRVIKLQAAPPVEPPVPPPVLKLPRKVGLVWPTPGPEPVHPSHDWLAEFRAYGFQSIRSNFHAQRDGDNLIAQAAAIQSAGFDLLPIIEWPYYHPNPADIVAFANWLLDRVQVGWVELHNEPWILEPHVTADEYMRIAGPVADAMEARGVKVILAMDLFDHSSGKDRRWPGVESVIRSIAASGERYAAIHPYRNPKAPSWSAWGSREAEHRAIVDRLGHSRFIVTETGGKPVDAPGWADGTYHEAELRILGGLGVESVYVYTHIGVVPPNPKIDFGLWDVDAVANTISPRPAATKLKTVLPSPVVGPPVIDRWIGNFMCFPGYPMAQDAFGWPETRYESFLRNYAADGNNIFPAAPWGGYDVKYTYDFRLDPAGFQRKIDLAHKYGVDVCVFLLTDGVNGWYMTEQEAHDWMRGFVPQLRNVRRFCAGWEFPQIDNQRPNHWTGGPGSGRRLLYWGKAIREVMPVGAELCVHWPPERITGEPDYPDKTTGRTDERAWWIEKNEDGLRGADIFDIVLYQRPPDERDEWTIAHTIGGMAPNNEGVMSYDVGDVNRIVGSPSTWGLRNKKLVAFEFARGIARHRKLSAAFLAYGKIGGVN